MLEFEKPMLAKLVKNIDHQGIGGKYIVLDRYGLMSYLIDKPLHEMTIAEYNYIKRRKDLYDLPDETKLYYGHVGTLGYFVSEDEIDGDIKEVEWDEAVKYLQ